MALALGDEVERTPPDDVRVRVVEQEWRPTDLP
jgi:hypothetical protein